MHGSPVQARSTGGDRAERVNTPTSGKATPVVSALSGIGVAAPKSGPPFHWSAKPGSSGCTNSLYVPAGRLKA